MCELSVKICFYNSIVRFDYSIFFMYHAKDQIWILKLKFDSCYKASHDTHRQNLSTRFAEIMQQNLKKKAVLTFNDIFDFTFPKCAKIKLAGWKCHRLITGLNNSDAISSIYFSNNTLIYAYQDIEDIIFRLLWLSPIVIIIMVWLFCWFLKIS